MLSENEGREVLRSEDFFCHLLQELRGEFVELVESVVHAFKLVVVQEGFGGVEDVVLRVVAGHTNLALNLLHGGSELRRREGLFDQTVQLFAHQAAALVHVFGIAAEVDGPCGGVGVVGQRGFHGIDQSAALAKGDVEAGVHAWAAEEVVEEVEGYAAVVLGAVCGAANHDVCLVGGTAFHGDPLHRVLAQHGVGGGIYWVGRFPWDGISLPRHGGWVGGECLDDSLYISKGVVAHDEENHPLWLVEPLGKGFGVGRGEAAHVVGCAEDVVAQVASLVDDVLEVVEDEVGGGVVVGLYFIDDDLALLVDFDLGIDGVEHHVEEKLGCTRQVFFHEGRIDHRLLLVGVGIEVAAHTLHAVDDVPGVAMGRALEHHVFAEVCHALFRGQFVARAGSDGNTAVGHGRLGGHVDETKS